MKVVFQKTELTDVLGPIQGMIKRNQLTSMTGCVILEADSGLVTLKATNIDDSYIGRINAEVLDDGMICIDGRLLFNAAKLADVELLVSEEENRWIYLGDREMVNGYHVVGMNPDDYPEIPEYDPKHQIDITSEALEFALKRVLSVPGDTEDKRAHVNGVWFEIHPDRISLLSTDGARLSAMDAAKYDGDGPYDSAAALIPKYSLRDLLPLFTMGGLRVGMNGTALVFENLVTGEIITTRMMEGQFPDAAKVFAIKDGSTEIVFDRVRLIRILERALLMVNQDYKGGIFTFAPDRIKIQVTNPDRGEFFEEIPVKVVQEGWEAQEIALNPRLMLEMLKIITVTDVVFRVKDRKSPVQIVENGVIRQVLMPMQA